MRGETESRPTQEAGRGMLQVGPAASRSPVDEAGTLPDLH